ncbi:MAG: hypothetical protein WED13_07760, partial [Methyloceanibacter sp.]
MSASSKELAPKGPVPPAHPQGAGSVVDFGQTGAEAESGDAPANEAPLDLAEILASVRETAYRWDF